MRSSAYERSQKERLVLLVAIFLVFFGGVIGTYTELSLNTFLGAIITGIFAMGWIVASTVASGLNVVDDKLGKIVSELDKVDVTFNVMQHELSEILSELQQTHKELTKRAPDKGGHERKAEP